MTRLTPGWADPGRPVDPDTGRLTSLDELRDATDHLDALAYLAATVPGTLAPSHRRRLTVIARQLRKVAQP
jgi:hypothetical protein